MKRKRSKKKWHRKYKKTVVIGYTVLAIIFLILIVLIKSCINDESKIQSELPPDFNMEFDDSKKITYYNHYSKKYETKALDEYLFHVVAAEMPASYGKEALKAQAVAARTYTVRHMEKDSGCKTHNCTVCTDSKCCQAYKSHDKLKQLWGKDYAMYCKKIYEAVTETSGIIVTYNNEPIDALYHSCSGGYTENSENVYSYKMPYLRSVKSDGENEFEKIKTVKSISYHKLCDTLNEEFGQKLKKSNIKRKIKIVSRFESGRVDKIKVGDATVTGKQFREALELKSADFTIDFEKSTVKITTIGYGHGVGMSQAGAAAMAKDGKNYKQILLYYYTKCAVKSMRG